MLILNREDGQQIHLYRLDGSPIATITVCKTRVGRTRIGIKAPRDVQVLRDNAKTDVPREKKGRP